MWSHECNYCLAKTKSYYQARDNELLTCVDKSDILYDYFLSFGFASSIIRLLIS